MCMYQDCGNYTPAEGGGANGCIQYEAEFVPGISSRGDGLHAALARLQELHREVAEHVSLADLVYMAAAAALEQRGLAGLQMIYGRVDGGASSCLPAKWAPAKPPFAAVFWNRSRQILMWRSY